VVKSNPVKNGQDVGELLGSNLKEAGRRVSHQDEQQQLKYVVESSERKERGSGDVGTLGGAICQSQAKRRYAPSRGQVFLMRSSRTIIWSCFSLYGAGQLVKTNPPGFLSHIYSN
jgi:hypothetical protein